MKKYEIDMCNGPLVKKVLVFSVPLMLSGILQLLYNAADIIIVGRYSGNTALAAVGSTASLIQLIINLFIGLSLGAGVVTAKYIGAGNRSDTQKCVHTSMAVSLIAGLISGVFGFFMSETFLKLMGTPDDIIAQAALYLKIYFLGIPALIIYNFGAAILRAMGDTVHPLRFLMISGILNVILNLVFVIVFHLGVAGVAIATVVSEYLSFIFVIMCLINLENDCKLNIKKIKVDKRMLKEILRIGLPAGIQNTIFSISNVMIQSSVNTFGSIVVAGNTAAQNIEGFAYASMNSIAQASLTFTGQNVGALKLGRVKKVFSSTIIIVTIIGLFMGWLLMLLGKPLLSVYSSDPDVWVSGMVRFRYILTVYFLCGIMDTIVGVIRGMGNSTVPMIISIVAICVFRIVWLYTVFPHHRTLGVIYITYAISWLIAILAQSVCYFVTKNRLIKKSAIVKE